MKAGLYELRCDVRKLVLAISIAACSSFSAASAVNSTITSLMVDKNYTGRAFVNLAHAPTGTCTTNTAWEFVLDTSDEMGKLIYTNLLTLYATGNTATFTGTGLCDEPHAGIEQLRRVELK